MLRPIAFSLTFSIAVGLAMFGASQARATTIIEILCSSTETCGGKYTGTTADGTIFVANPLPTNPSTGTGVFQPFKRVQRNGSGLQSGFSTDESGPDINFDTKGGLWTRSVQMWEFDFFTINNVGYVELILDANEAGQAQSSKNQITLTQMQIFIGSNADLARPEAADNDPNTTGYTGPGSMPSRRPTTLCSGLRRYGRSTTPPMAMSM